jgi:hypothetical protein
VAHSLGVTLARDTMRRYPALARDVVAFVGIAGGNHGTSICRGIETSYYGCNALVPGSPWLARLSGAGGSRETPGPTKWMTIYNGSAGDPYFDPPNDEASPRLRGAVNVAFPGDYSNDLRVDPAELDTYLPFLLRSGRPDRTPRAAAQSSPAGSRACDRTACDEAICAGSRNWRDQQLPAALQHCQPVAGNYPFRSDHAVTGK